jgi:23S rRNA-/tRNA-specific pseudouridylate synthase
VSDTAVPIVVLHDDGALVAVVKPSGEPVNAARGEPASDCLQKRLERQRGRRIYVVHRIDRDASGVVLFALDATAHRAGEPGVRAPGGGEGVPGFRGGRVTPGDGRLDMPLHSARRTRRGRTVSLVEARPRTGCHHQLRVHLRSANVDPL